MGGVDPNGGFTPDSEGGVRLNPGEIGHTGGSTEYNPYTYMQSTPGFSSDAERVAYEAAQQARFQQYKQQQDYYKQQQAQQQDKQREAARINEYGGAGEGEYGPSRASDPFFGRSDIYAVTDTKQKALMDTGLTQYQAAEQLRFEAQEKGDYAGMRYYETLRMQAWTTATGKSAAYHYNAKESGLPQAINPYENYADLLTYSEKGYPQNKKDVFSPVDYTQLGLPGGQGGQAYIWGNKPYDLRGAADVAAYALRRGDMGPYGNLGTPYSSAYGNLSLEDQQAIGRYVNENPVHQARGFITKDTMGGFTDSVRTMDQGTFVPTMGLTSAAAGSNEPKKPFVSYQANESVVTRPSDATLSAMSMWGGDNSNPIARGLVTMYDFLTPGTVTRSGMAKPVLVDRESVFKAGGAAFTPKFIGAGNKPTDTMTFEKGSPYMKDGKMYQDYENVNLSKVWVTPTYSTTSPTKSGWERGEGVLSDKAYNWLGERFGISGEQARAAVGMSAYMQKEITNYNPTFQNIGTNMALAEIKNSLDKPAEAGVWFGIGLISGGVFRSAEVGYGAARASIAERVISQGGNWRRAIQGGDFAFTNLPKALGAVYAVDIAGRSTAWGTNLKAGDVSAKASTILFSEAIPMAGGSLVGYYAPELASFAYQSAVRTPGKISDAIWTTRQRMAGITRVEPGTMGYDYTVTGTPVYEVPRGAYPSSTPRYYNDAGTWSWGGVQTKAPEAVPTYDVTPTVDLTPTLDLQTGKWSITRPGNVATPAEQRMIITQFKLTKGEIALAKKQGLTLNDILYLREEVAPPSIKVQAKRHAYEVANTVVELTKPKSSSSLFGNQELVGNNLIRRLYTESEGYAISVAGTQQQQITRPLFGQKELVGNNLIRQLYPPRQEQGIRTIDLTANAYTLSNIGAGRTLTTSEVKNKSLTIPISGTRGLTLPRSDTRITTINTEKTISLTRQFPRSDIITRQGSLTRGFEGLWTTGKGGGGSIPLLIPPWGGSGGSGWGSRRGGGRKLTQVFTVDFGRVTSTLFSPGAFSSGMGRGKTKKKRKR